MNLKMYLNMKYFMKVFKYKYFSFWKAQLKILKKVFNYYFKIQIHLTCY